MTRHDLPADGGRGVVGREETFVVPEDRQVKSLDAAVRLEDLAEVALLALVDGPADPPLLGLDDVLLRKLEIVGLLHTRQAVPAGEELVRGAQGGVKTDFREERRAMMDLMEIKRRDEARQYAEYARARPRVRPRREPASR